MDQEFDILSKIQKVEASPLLLQRIEQKIIVEINNNVSIKWVTAIAASVALLICFNIFALDNRAKNDKMNLVKNMNLINDNNLYYE